MNIKSKRRLRAPSRARAVAMLAIVVLSTVLPVNVRSIQSTNLLQNGSMETFYTYATDPGTGEPLTVVTGWHIFVESGSPYFMSSQQFAWSPWGTGHVEGYEGNDLQMIFAPNGPEAYVAGLYQQVHGLTPAVAYAFSGRMTNASNNILVGRRLGFDPYGGTDPRSPNVIWGVDERGGWSWRNYYMAEVARSSTATVFIRLDHPANAGANNSETFLDAFVMDVAPRSHFNSLPVREPSSSFGLGWGVDWIPPDTTLDRYQAQYRDGAEPWTGLTLGGNLDTGLTFSGQDCHTYGFRARAVVMHLLPNDDNVGSRLPGYWQPEGQVTTTVLTAPPTSAVGSLAAYQSERFTVSWSGSAGSCGLTGYDVQVRDGASGAWSDWLVGTAATSASFVGQDGHSYYFRSRAAGAGRYHESYPSDADALTTVDSTALTVTVSPLPLVEITTTFPVSWSAVDTVSGVNAYDVQTRSVRLADGLDSGWRLWFTNTQTTLAQFSAVDGMRYDFRVTARDAVGNAGSAIAGANVLLTPAPVLVTSDLAASTALPRQAEAITFTVGISNTGNLSATSGLILSLPVGIGQVISGSVVASAGSPILAGGAVTWVHPLAAGTGVVVTAAIMVSSSTSLGTRASAQAVISDGVHLPFTRTLALLVPYQAFLPLTLRQ